MKNRFDHELDTLTLQQLEKLRYEVHRDAAVAREARAKFVAQAKRHANQPVSKPWGSRLNGWMFISNLFRRKEQKPMMATFGSLVIVLVLLFGSAGATVHAAQGSLPDEALYSVKVSGEQVQLALTTRTQSRIRLLLRFSDQRVDEMLILLAEGKSIPQETITRLETHYRMALQSAAGLDEPAMLKALQQIENHLHFQEQRLQGANASSSEDAVPALEKVREMLRQQLRQVGEGMDDPLIFRSRTQQHLPVGIPPVSETRMPGGNRSDLQRCQDCTPAQGGTPACENCPPVSDGYGPGPGPQGTPVCEDCTPAFGGPQNQGGTSQPGGQNTDQPGSGGGTSGGGSGTGEPGGTGGNDNDQGDGSGGGTGTGGTGGTGDNHGGQGGGSGGGSNHP